MGLYMGYQRSYVVLYGRKDIMAPGDAPFAFKCWADDADHAEEQCQNVNTRNQVLWVVETADVDAAYDDYWGNHA